MKQKYPYTLLSLGLFASAGVCLASNKKTSLPQSPNFIVILCDDLGYGDLSCYGSPTIKTPHLDKMAAQGQRWGSFYAGASVSTPSRATLMTGRYAIRSGQTKTNFPYTQNGLPHDELTIAELLKTKGYTTALVGKWHLGHADGYRPTSHGFDYFYGIPFSNDMSKKEQERMGNKNYNYKLPFYHQDEIIEWEPDQSQTTQQLTDYVVNFLQEKQSEPFFLHLAYTQPHVPIYASEKFRGKSARGLYGDCVEEIDHSVGEILSTLEKEGLKENTLVVFFSDNGPWLSYKQLGGSAGPLRDGKSSAYEGGFRVPGIFWGGGITPNYVTCMGSALDILPTLCEMAGVALPNDRVYDGRSLTPALEGEVLPNDAEFFYYRENELYAARWGDYKAIFATKPTYQRGDKVVFSTPELYHVNIDPEERFNIAAKHPEVIAKIQKAVERHRESLEKMSNLQHK